jgi:ribose-phosphate pyrophosphokinase
MTTLAPMDPESVRFFSGSSNPQLASDICSYLGVPLGETHISRFSNDDLYIQLGSSVRGREVFVVQSLTPPVNDHLVELLMMLDIARSSAAKEVHAIIPYFSFARSDKKDAPRISITARLIADLLQTAGATHVMTIMLHSPQVHGFFSMPTDPLTSRPVLKKYFLGRDLSDTIVISPDMGQAKSAARFAKELGLPVAAGNKERISDTKVRINGIIGDQLSGIRRALVYDDEIATGGSIEEITFQLIKAGIEEVWVACTHGVFVKGGLERLAVIPQVTEIVTTDTVYLAPEQRHPKLHIVSIASLLGDAIQMNQSGQSISNLFAYGDGNN